MRRFPFLLVLLWSGEAPLAQTTEGRPTPSLIGVASGSATADGRPLLWKSRRAAQRDNVVAALDDGKIPYFALCDAGSLKVAHGGANTSGFCIVDTEAPELPLGSTAGPDNGEFTKLALQRCSSVAEFEALLRAGNEAGRRTQGHFAVIDGFGAAAIFEVGGRTFTRIDAAQAAHGVLIRGGGASRSRAEELCTSPAARSMTPRFLLQQFLRDVKPPATAAAGPEPGLQDASETVHSASTVSALVMHGVMTGEDVSLTTMWSMLGQPLFTIAVPLWPAGRTTPREIAGDPRAALCEASKRFQNAFYVERPAGADDPRTRRWLRTADLPLARRTILFAEAELLGQVADAIDAIRSGGQSPSPAALREMQDTIARRVLPRLGKIVDQFVPGSQRK